MLKEQHQNSNLQDASEEIRVSILISSSLMEKIKVMAGLEGTLPKQEVQNALKERIERYERENGSILNKNS